MSVQAAPARRHRLREKPWFPVAGVSVFFLASLFWQEVFLKLYCFRLVPVRGILLTLLFSAPIAMLLGVLCCAVRPETGRRLLVFLTAVLCIWLGTQTVYYHLFQTFLSLSSLIRTPMVAGEFGGMALGNILKSWFPILMLCLPFAGAVWRCEWILSGGRATRRNGIR